MKINAIATSSFLLFALVSSTVQAQASKDHEFFMPNDLNWTDVPSLPKGAKVAVMEGPVSEAKPFTMRIKLPANYKIPPHSHTGIEHITVISGTFNLGMGKKFDQAKTQAMPIGGFAFMPPGAVHFASTTEPTIVQVHGVGPWVINYVDPKDDPRKQ